MVGYDEHAVVLAEILKRSAFHLQIVLAAAPDKREVGVVIADRGALLLQQFDDGERRRLAQIVDVFLVRDAQNQHLRSVDGLLLLVERGDGRRDHVVGHGHVDLARQFDETRVEVELLCLPREIKGIDGNAVSAQTRPGIERMKAERLGRGRVDDLPDVEIHAQAQHFELVDQRNVDAAVDVLEQFGHFRSRWR